MKGRAMKQAALALALMTAVLSLAGCASQKTEEHGSMSMEQCNKIMTQGLGKADVQYDLRFINEMIPHHRGAISMANDALQKSKRPEIKKLAQDIISAQEKEIEQLKAWRKQWYNH